MGGEIVRFKPAVTVSTDKDSDADADYIYAKVKAPVMSGFVLKAFCWTVEAPMIGPLVLQYLKTANLLTKVFIDSRYHEPPMHIPRYPSLSYEEASVRQVDLGLSSCERLASALECLPSRSPYDDGSLRHFCRWTIRDYSEAYRLGKITPTMVAQRFLQALQESEKSKPGMRFFINCDVQDVLKQAEESTSRYAKGEQLSILDGVPIALKDEIDCLPYSTTGGTKWLPKVRGVEADADCVKRLRDCGAVMLGKTNMHELGLGTTGINPNYGATRNPYDRTRFSGGSSGGSAAVVAAGLCPIALGVDGGGSVRMPSALCGVVGFKATFGRVSSHGVLPFNWTVGMAGIHASSVEDALLVYTVMHAHIPDNHIVSYPPTPNLPKLGDLGTTHGDIHMTSITLAKYTKWFEDCDKPILECCYKALNDLQERFECKVIDVTVPEIEEMRLAHYVTIGCECNTSLRSDYAKVGRGVSGFDARVAFAIYNSLNHREFLAAQRMRSRQMYYYMEIFKRADVIVTPTTACTAQPIRPNALKAGELNYVDGAKLIRYQIAANFLGLPAITVPVGYDTTGMPIGLQLMGRPWSEATLFRVAFTIEEMYRSKLRRPQIFYDLLI